MLKLRFATPASWKTLVRENLCTFLQDHAANERKVSASALTLASQHPHHDNLVATAIELAEEELLHFKQVYLLLRERGWQLAHDEPDPYMTELRRALRKRDVNEYLLDRLVLFAIIEARGYERFTLAAEAFTDEPLARFYSTLAKSEARHFATYLRLAKEYFEEPVVDARLQELLDVEAEILRALPLRPALH